MSSFDKAFLAVSVAVGAVVWACLAYVTLFKPQTITRWKLQH